MAAGKHAFLEKPVAVDPTGVRSILESGEIAKRKGLGIGAGTVRRRETGSRETVRRLQAVEAVGRLARVVEPALISECGTNRSGYELRVEG